MITIEQVEKLREYGNISFEEARRALEAADGSILEAVIALEKEGKIKPPELKQSIDAVQKSSDSGTGSSGETNSGNTANNGGSAKSSAKTNRSNEKSESIGSVFSNFLKWCGRVIDRGNKNSFEVTRYGEHIVGVPVTVLILLAIPFFWILVPLIIIGLFFEYRYSFKGPDLGKENINRAVNSATDAADGIKKSVKDAVNENKNADNNNNGNNNE